MDERSYQRMMNDVKKLRKFLMNDYRYVHQSTDKHPFALLKGGIANDI